MIDRKRLSLRERLRHRLVDPIRYLVESVATYLRGGTRVRILVLSDLAEYTSEQQIAPMRRHRSALRKQLGVTFLQLFLDDGLKLPTLLLRRFDLIFLKVGFKESRLRVDEILSIICQRKRPTTKLVWLDGDDDICVQRPEVLEVVDLYIKKQAFRDPKEYMAPRRGKSNLTDYCVAHHGADFSDDAVPAIEGARAELLDKIMVGWNIALDDKIEDLRRKNIEVPSLSGRKVDICSRAYCAETNWIYPFRGPLVQKLNELQREFVVLTPEVRVSQEEYYSEMLDSKVCVSPLGYGEVCWRDFEAILCGCVLVKPDVGHLITEPDVYCPNLTYVPVKWDHSDLVDTLRTLLSDPQRMEQLRARASEALGAFFARGGFVLRFANVLERLDLTRDGR